MSIIVHGHELAAPEGVAVRNFKDANVFRFVNARRARPVTELVIHETVTRSWQDTVAVLKQRNLGVHFIAAPDGTIYQHGDLQDDELWHASQHNPASVGIETVNPYEPRFMPRGGPWTDVIHAPWAAGGRYVLPPPAQAEAVCLLANWLTSTASGLQIPQMWPGLQGEQRLPMGRVPACANLAPGIYAHHFFAHADGAFLVLYTWLRLEPMLDPASAYAEAVRRATGAASSGVDLADYFTANPYLTS